VTGIQWTDAVWNPTTGCDRVSPGCDHCYAMTMAKRLKGMGQAKYQRDGDPRTSGPGFGLTVHHDALMLPLRWRKPKRIFTNSMSDLFHKDVPEEFIARVFAVMAGAPQHTFQVLTKRHARMKSLLSREDFWLDVFMIAENDYAGSDRAWPLPNVWLGVSAEDQHWANLRVPALIHTPAAVRFVSAEPLLGPIDLSRWLRGNVGEDARRELALDDQKRREGFQERLDIGDAPDHPRAYGLPSVSLNAVEVPPDMTAHLLLQPVDDFGSGAVDGHARGGHSADAVTHAEVALPVQKTSDVAEGGRVAGHPDRLAKQAGADAAEWPPVGSEAPLHSRTRGSVPGGNLSDGSPGGVRGLNLGDGQFDSTHNPYCINWLIVGGESGAGARPCELGWLWSLRWQCADAGVPIFVKQLGATLGREYGAGPHGADWDRWPEGLKVREFPRVAEAVAT
jgi:protein gp37